MGEMKQREKYWDVLGPRNDFWNATWSMVKKHRLGGRPLSKIATILAVEIGRMFCFPGSFWTTEDGGLVLDHAFLSEQLGYSADRVKRARKELEAAGIIQTKPVEGTYGARRVYRLHGVTLKRRKDKDEQKGHPFVMKSPQERGQIAEV